MLFVFENMFFMLFIILLYVVKFDFEFVEIGFWFISIVLGFCFKNLFLINVFLFVFVILVIKVNIFLGILIDIFFKLFLL